MRWDKMRESTNIEDRRSGGRLTSGTGRLGIGGIVIIVVISFLLGKNPLDMLALVTDMTPTTQQAPAQEMANDSGARFVRAVLGDTEDVWSRVFSAQLNQSYHPPKLVMFRGVVSSACGQASTAVGPFYCPADQKVYIDLSFFDELAQRFGAPGDFARAYVIAHEVGHHVQNLLGIAAKVQAAGQGRSQRDRNALSVRQELQADCLAGVWGKYAAERNLLEPGDMEAAFRAAQAIGDDRLQQQAQGRVVPDSFTHGTSAQRLKWFRSGLQSGRVKSCNTFSAQGG